MAQDASTAPTTERCKPLIDAPSISLRAVGPAVVPMCHCDWCLYTAKCSEGIRRMHGGGVGHANMLPVPCASALLPAIQPCSLNTIYRSRVLQPPFVLQGRFSAMWHSSHSSGEVLENTREDSESLSLVLIAELFAVPALLLLAPGAHLRRRNYEEHNGAETPAHQRNADPRDDFEKVVRASNEIEADALGNATLRGARTP